MDSVNNCAILIPMRVGGINIEKLKERRRRQKQREKERMLKDPVFAKQKKEALKAAKRRWLERNPDWHKDYLERNKEKLFKYRQEYRKKNLEKITAYEAGRVSRIRKQTLDAYGRVCVCCGETNEAFLTLDHFTEDKGNRIVWKGRTYASKRGHSEYMRLKKLGWPPIVRVMCMNCNFAIRYNKPCPHELERRVEIKSKEP